MPGFKNIFISSIITAIDDAADFKPDQVISFLDKGHDVPNFGMSGSNHLIFTDVDDTDDWGDTFAPSTRMLKSIIDFCET